MKRKLRGRGVAEILPVNHKALSPSPIITTKKRKKPKKRNEVD
jgi:hypothetical protein